jgi:hypothetical protein
MASLFPNAAAQADAAAAEPPDNGAMVDLRPKIDSSECYARNVSAAFPMSNLFIGDSRLGCKSDADEQLILHISFSEFVKVHSIKLTEFNRGMEPELNPTLVKLYVNRESMGFEDCEDIDPTQTLHLSAADLKEDAGPIPLKFVKFQRVRSITVFVEDNAGGEISALGMMNFFGRPIHTTNMKEFKKQG